MITRSSLRHPALVFVTALVPALALAQQSGSSIATSRIFDAIGVREGITVCEIGAGDGALSLEAAQIVGPGGRVFTSELGDERLKALRSKTGASGLSNITVVTGSPETTNFPDGACDALFMRNVYHHFGNPALMNASIVKALKPGGRVAIVDFAPPAKEAERAENRGKDGMHGVTADTVSRETKEAGLEPVSSETGAQRWFMIVAARPGAPGGAPPGGGSA
jgi:ubiquinone/menaquinone biosynthesis C-methylase UbiE